MTPLQAREKMPEVELCKTEMVNEEQCPQDRVSLYFNLFLQIVTSKCLLHISTYKLLLLFCFPLGGAWSNGCYTVLYLLNVNKHICKFMSELQTSLIRWPSSKTVPIKQTTFLSSYAVCFTESINRSRQHTDPGCTRRPFLHSAFELQ